MLFGVWSNPVKQETEIPSGGYQITQGGTKTAVTTTTTITEGEVTGGSAATVSGTATIPASDGEGVGTGWNFANNTTAANSAADFLFGSTAATNGWLWATPGSNSNVVRDLGIVDFNSVTSVPTTIGSYTASLDFVSVGPLDTNSVVAIRTQLGKFAKIKILSYTKGATGSCTFQYVYQPDGNGNF
jgi:hypothetical protein